MLCCVVLHLAASEAMRGSTPLDVAASSVMDNNGLALALEEPDLEKVCGVGGWGWEEDCGDTLQSIHFLSFIKFKFK